MSDNALIVDGLGKVYYIADVHALRQAKNAYWRCVKEPMGRLRAVLNGQSAFAHQRPFWALRDISFDLKWGEVVGVIGANGAGKTTLLRVLARITAPSEGEVRVYGTMGSLLEVGAAFSIDLTGRENIYLTGSIYGFSRKEIKSKFDELVDFAEVEEFIDTPVKKYSSGMYSRLAFAVGTYFTSDILIVDEVLATGDSVFAKKCLAKMRREAFNGRSILFVSHNESTVREICTRCIYLKSGKMEFNGPIDTAYAMYNAAAASLAR